jgi:DnaK suppressor protein
MSFPVALCLTYASIKCRTLPFKDVRVSPGRPVEGCTKLHAYNGENALSAAPVVYVQFCTDVVPPIGHSLRSPMALIWIDEPEEGKMDAKKITGTRRRLSREYENLIRSMNRSRLAVEEIKVENTEDEGDLATISHNRHVHYNLHEGDFARLRFIEKAIKALDCGQYGECERCGKSINEKRLQAVPWATTCIRCQEKTEAESISSRMVLAGLGAGETESF